MTTGQVDYNRAGLQDYSSLHFDSQGALPCFLLFNGSSKRQPKAEVANAG